MELLNGDVQVGLSSKSGRQAGRYGLDWARLGRIGSRLSESLARQVRLGPEIFTRFNLKWLFLKFDSRVMQNGSL